MGKAMSQPERQAWALSYAMRARPSPDLASRYFDALKRMLGTAPARGTPPDARPAGGLGADPAANKQNHEETACRTR